MLHLDDVRRLFREALREVWGDVGDRVVFDVLDDAPANGVLVAISYDSHAAEAKGRELLRHASNHILRVAPKLLERPTHIVKKFLLHEAIHVGYPGHDQAFEAVAAAVGTASTENAIEGRDCVVEVQRKKGGRFQKVFHTPDRATALAFARDKRAGDGKYRVVY